MKKEIILVMMSSLLLLSACTEKKNEVKSLTSGIKIENLDLSANPAEDFYQFACGGWIKNNPLTGEYARYGSFDQLAEQNREQLKTLIEGIAGQNNGKGTISQKIGDLYLMGMDSNAIEKQGAVPIQPILQNIQALKSKNDLTNCLVDLHLHNITPFFTVFGEGNPENSEMTIAWVWQSGLGIGDRDYYLEDKSEPIRKEYLNLISRLLTLSGYSKMADFENKEKNMAEKILKLETEMAKLFMNKNDLRDPYKTFNLKKVEELQNMLSVININQYLNGMGLSTNDALNISQPEYIRGLNKILKTTDLEVIKAYLSWNVIQNAAPYLSQDFVNTDFYFYGKVLSGKEENKPRWKRVIETVENALGEAVGEEYVKKYFPAEAKQRMLHLVENLQWALSERIKQNTWMADSTKAKAIDKLSSFIVKIGYPDKWRDYSALTISRDSYFANIMRAAEFESKYQLAKIGKPVDRSTWYMTPQTVNAYYNPSTNEICFPAGILQPPFFDMNADDAFNYGAIGVVIGHEMTHGFDDQGRNYNKAGNLENWWSEKDAQNFTERAQGLIKYFNRIEVFPGLFANGQFTLGENIADNGGLNVSFTAFQKAKKEGTIQDVMDGYTAEQRFFIAYAGVWANNIRDEEIQRRTKEDSHSLGKWRVNATLPHITPFIEAFNVKEGNGMWLNSEARVQIW